MVENLQAALLEVGGQRVDPSVIFVFNQIRFSCYDPLHSLISGQYRPMIACNLRVWIIATIRRLREFGHPVPLDPLQISARLYIH